MPWVKVDDQFFRHPKTLAAGRDARDLYLVGLCYCAQTLTDGFIPAASIRVLAAEAEIDTGLASAARLVAVGLWEEVEGGYAVHDYLEYQPSKDRVLATREVRADAGRRGGKQKASNLLSKTLANEKQNSTPYPSRTHPNITTATEQVGSTHTVHANGMNGTDGADAPPAQVTTPAPPSRSRKASGTLTIAQQARFDRWYAAYPKREHRPDAERAWRNLDPDDDLTARLIADAAARQNGRKWAQGYIELPASYLNKHVWEDDIETTWERAGPRRMSRDEQRMQNNLRAVEAIDW